MPESKKPAVGAVLWRDLTVADADSVRDFYREVVGWGAHPHPMGDYDDYEMRVPGTEETVAGICHARGPNATMPPQWIVYVVVESVEASAKRCVENGGEVVDGPRLMGQSPFCVVRDPAGAVLGLMES